MNKVLLIGRLTRDPEIRYTQQNNTAIARYTLAVERMVKNSEQSADFIRCVCFGKTAEFAEKYFYKGIKIAITGRIQTGSYTDQEGKTVYTTDIVVENQEFCESRSASSAAPSAQPSPSHASQFMDIPDGIDEELPFN